MLRVTIPRNITLLINDNKKELYPNDVDIDPAVTMLGGAQAYPYANLKFHGSNFEVPISDYTMVKEGDLLVINLKTSSDWEDKLINFFLV